MVVAAGIIGAVADDRTHADKAAVRTVRYRIVQVAAAARGVDQVISAADLPRGACLEEVVRRIARRDEIRPEHIRLQLAEMTALIPVIDVGAPVIIDQNPRIVENALIPGICRIIHIVRKKRERTLRMIADRDTAL